MIDDWGDEEPAPEPVISPELGRAVPLPTRRGDSIVPERLVWGWANRIPAGGLTLLSGRPGQGKTTLAAWLCARWSRGELPGDWWGRPVSVIYVSAEDPAPTVMLPRMMAAGADLSRVHLLDARDHLLGLPDDVPRLRESVEQTGARVIFLDPVTAALGGSDTHRDNSIRAALAPLAALAADRRLAVGGIVHYRKSGGSDPLEAINGSVGFGGLARAALAVGTDPEDDNCRVVAGSKSNWAPSDAPGLRFRIEGANVADPDGEDLVTSKIVMLGECEVDLSRLAAVADREGDADRDEAAEFISNYLDARGGTAPANEVLRAATAAGLTRRTVQRARLRAGAETEKEGLHGGWLWSLDSRRRHEGAEDATPGCVAPSGAFAEQVAPSETTPTLSLVVPTPAGDPGGAYDLRNL